MSNGDELPEESRRARNAQEDIHDCDAIENAMEELKQMVPFALGYSVGANAADLHRVIRNIEEAVREICERAINIVHRHEQGSLDDDDDITNEFEEEDPFS